MNMEITEIWEKTLSSVKSSINSTVGYNVHIKSSTPVSLISSVFTISVPTSINKNIIEFRYKNFIESSLEKVTGQKLSLEIVVGDVEEEEPEEDINEEEKSSIPDDDNLLYRVNPKYTFENFVVGNSNNIAYEASKKIADNPGYIYNPLFLYGNSGLGKTHLMHAIGNRIKANNKNVNILCVTSEHFTNEFLASIRDNTTYKFKSKYRKADVLLVDDVQFLQKTEVVQEEFFHTFNELYSLGKQIVLTSDRRPNDLKILADRMKTRFAQGFTIDISVPNYETRVVILQRKAQAQHVHIDNDVLGYIADNIRSNVRELEGALLNVISNSEIQQCDITMDFVKQTLDSVVSSEDSIKITPAKIIKKVSLYYNLSENDITGKIKTKDIAIPRQVSMYLCRKLLSMTNTMISKEFGKDRTTVKHNIEKIEAEILTDEKLNSDINYIMKDIESM